MSNREPTKAEAAAKQRMMEWQARNRKFRQDAAARRAQERTASKQSPDTKKEHIMSKRSFTDADGDTYTTTLSESGHNIVITYQNGESGDTEVLILKAADGLTLANHIVNVLREWKP